MNIRKHYKHYISLKLFIHILNIFQDVVLYKHILSIPLFYEKMSLRHHDKNDNVFIETGYIKCNKKESY